MIAVQEIATLCTDSRNDLEMICHLALLDSVVVVDVAEARILDEEREQISVPQVDAAEGSS